MTIRDSLKQTSDRFKKKQIPTASLDAAVLLCFVLKKSKEHLYTYPEQELSKSQQTKFQELIKQREKGIPVAYLTKHKEFYGLDFFVDKRVLIPRPETELLVEEIINASTDSKTRQNRHSELVSESRFGRGGLMAIVEIGTGSGCVSIALAKHLPNAKITATDLSGEALKVARKNATKHQVKIIFKKGNLLTPIKNQPIDILVANLPYLDRDWTNPTIKHEPKGALFTGEHGLAKYHELLEQIRGLKKRPALMLFEFDPRQAEAMRALIKKILPEAKASFIRDLCGRVRVVRVSSSDNHRTPDKHSR